MIIGIVGSEATKFTPETEEKARQAIRELLGALPPMSSVTSGECHLGGIDIWAKEEALKLDIPFIPFPPKKLQWEGGYKQRNIQIAKTADHVVCISVLHLPDSYDGLMFDTCYHHSDESRVPEHIKSGGCWTTKYARGLGKTTRLIVIE